ncbi:TIGR04219 family outer membrane beta-barrel protein [Shewanella marina]|uniref:TIGR04219 family outer membrane beta-barrel protein n=1 Tax=Shewanella marina TaxID=487319 RepID=UPI000470F321|nr:TIGR04219 family outer membrane beta-barrel protein [Shewanella marina]
MKKTLLATTLLAALTATSAQASTLIGLKVGGDYWQPDTKGQVSFDGNTGGSYDYDSSAQGSLWVALEHPIPLVPNVMIRETRISEKVNNGAENARANLSNTDFIGYYEILDNDLVSLDLGAAYKLMHGSHSATDVIKQDLDDGTFMGYADAKVGVPGLGLFGFATVMTGIDESKVYDYSIGLGWQFEGMALDYRLRAGYRDFNYDANNSGINADLSSKGYFAGVEIAF